MAKKSRHYEGNLHLKIAHFKRNSALSRRLPTAFKLDSHCLTKIKKPIEVKVKSSGSTPSQTTTNVIFAVDTLFLALYSSRVVDVKVNYAEIF